MKHCLVFASLISPSKMILLEKKYQTFDTVFHHQMKHLEVRQKYSAAPRIFNSLLGVSSGDETLHLMFDILHETRHLILDILVTLLPTLGIVAYPEDLSPSNSSVILLANAWRYPLASFSSLTLNKIFKNTGCND